MTNLLPSATSDHTLKTENHTEIQNDQVSMLGNRIEQILRRQEQKELDDKMLMLLGDYITVFERPFYQELVEKTMLDAQ